jgi:hypothetical protein
MFPRRGTSLTAPVEVAAVLRSIIGYMFVRPFLRNAADRRKSTATGQRIGRHAAHPQARQAHQSREAGAHRRVARVPVDAGGQRSPKRRVSL